MYSEDIAQLAQSLGDNAELKKALSAASSGFTGINLERPAALMLPFIAPIRTKMPVDHATMGGPYVQYRVQLGYGSYNFGSNMGTAEAGIGASTSGSATNFQANYATQAVSNEVYYEAIPQARGYDDLLAVATSEALATLMRQEEVNLLGGNRAALDVSGASVAASAGGSGSITAPAYVTVTALTLAGYLADVAGGYSTTGESVVATEVAVTGAGASKAYVNVSWNPVPGAVAYRVYGGATGAETLYANSGFYYPSASTSTAKITAPSASSTCVTVTSIQIQANVGTQAIPSTDHSASTTMFEGLIAWSQKNTIYSQALPSNHYQINQAGAALTQQGAGIVEFDNVLQNLWLNWNIGPQRIITSAKGAGAVTEALIAANNVSLYRWEMGNENGALRGGAFVGSYLNKYAASVLGSQQAQIDVWAHPYMPDGTFLFITDQIPYGYAREARGWALDILQPYTYFPLAQSSRTYPFSLFNIETVKCYHPLAQASIVGARVE